jgi:hypothetical protein
MIAAWRAGTAVVTGKKRIRIEDAAFESDGPERREKLVLRSAKKVTGKVHPYSADDMKPECFLSCDGGCPIRHRWASTRSIAACLR